MMMKTNLPYKLTSSQIQAIKQIQKKKYCILTNDCGTGKTAIGACSISLSKLPTTIICPASKQKDWKDITDLFPDANVVKITSFNQAYKILTKDFKGLLLVDEAHNMGGWGTQRGRKIINLGKRADKAIYMTATPSFNRPMDFYWLLKLCRAYTGTTDEFKIKFNGAFHLPYKKFLILGRPCNLDKLGALFNLVKVNTSGNRKLTIHKRKIITKSYGYDNPRFEEVAEFRRLVADNKFEAFKKFVELGKLADRCIIFTHHKKITKACTELLGCDMLIGGMSEKNRKRVIKDFSEGKKDYLVISINAGGEGLDIENCDTCFFLELSFSPLKDRQAFLRMARSEADKELFVSFFISKDEHTWQVNRNKEDYLEEMCN